jgi:Uma2 family endonuclease
MIQMLTKTKKEATPPVHRFTVDEYHQMIDAGILTTNHKVELLKGWIVDKMPQNPPHITSITRLGRWLMKALPEESWTVRLQGPITLSDSEPEPDIVVARGPDSRYEKRHPGPGDIVLAVEVADSSFLDDRRGKCPLYAAAKIPEFWLINLQSKRAEIFTNPKGGSSPFYRNILECSMGESIPLILDGQRFGEIKIKQLLS